MLKPVDLEATCSVVWPEDPAVDQANSDLTGYIKGLASDPGCWRKYLKFKDGEQPTEFMIGVIPSHLLLKAEDEYGTSKSLFWSSFLYGLRDIKNPGGLVAEFTDKVTGQKKREVPTIEVSGIQYVDSAWLSKIMSRKLRDCAIFVGGVAYRWNQLSEDDLKNS